MTITASAALLYAVCSVQLQLQLCPSAVLSTAAFSCLLASAASS